MGDLRQPLKPLTGTEWEYVWTAAFRQRDNFPTSEAGMLARALFELSERVNAHHRDSSTRGVCPICEKVMSDEA